MYADPLLAAHAVASPAPSSAPRLAPTPTPRPSSPEDGLAVEARAAHPVPGLGEVAIVIVAYQAERTIASVLDRLPHEVASRVGAVLVSDDASSDRTADVARAWAQTHLSIPVTVVHQATNLGYGGNQKFCYSWARRVGLRHVVMVHGDGQYAPELVLDMVEPLLRAEAAVVFGSRMLTKGGARQGGMPRYKQAGNRILTGFQNRMTGLRLSEWHTGYRAYSMDALAGVDLDAMSDGFDFDTEIILGLADTLPDPGRDVVEIAIPTFYGDEKCHVNGFKYAMAVVVDVVRHRSRRQLAMAG